MASAAVKSFLGGVVSPAVWARTDTAKRAYGLEACDNFFVNAQGACVNRPGGTKIVATRCYGTVTFSANPADGNTVTLNGGGGSVTFEFESGGGVSGGNTSVAIGGTAAITMTNLIAAVAAAGISLTATAGIPSATSTNFIATTPFVPAWSKSGQNITVTTPTCGAARIMSFVFGGTDSVVLEMGNGYMRFSVNGTQTTVSGVSAYSSTTLYEPGDLVSSSGINYYCIANTVGNAPQNVSYWYALSGSVYEIPTPWDATEVFQVDYDGYANVRFFTGGGATGYKLKRYSATKWILDPIDYLPTISPPQNIALSASGTGTTRRYKVTAIKKKTGEQSFPGNGATCYTGALSNGSPAKIRVSASNSLANNDDVLIVRVYSIGATSDPDFEAALLGKVFNVSAVSGTTFDLDNTTGLTIPSGGYALTAIDLTTGTVLYPAALNGGGDDNFRPNYTAHGLADGDEVYCAGIAYFLALPQPAITKALVGKTFRVAVIDANNFELLDTNGIATPVGSVDTILIPTAVTLSNKGANVAVTITWNAVPEAQEYWIFKELSGVYGFIGRTPKLTYTDDNTTAGPNGGESVPITSDVPPRFVDPTHAAYPAGVAIVQQRLALGGGDDSPTLLSLSRAGDVLNFSHDIPISDNSGFPVNVLGYTVETIKHLGAADGRLFIFTEGDVWLMGGAADGTLSPDAPNLSPVAYVGCGALQPLRIGRGFVFADRFRGRLFDVGFDYRAGGWSVSELSDFAPHLVEGHTLADWCYCPLPDPTVYATRDDGVILGMTYIRERNVYAWFRIVPRDGDVYESVAAAPETGGWSLYAVCKRSVNGYTVRYIERFAQRYLGLDDYDFLTDANFVDCSVYYNGLNLKYDASAAAAGTTLTLTTGTTWVAGQSLTLTASAAVFQGTAGDVGDQWRLQILDDDGEVTAEVDVTVTVQSSTTVCTVTAAVNVPAALQGQPTETWYRLITTMTGLDHLEDEHVGGLIDGMDIEAESGNRLTVASGSVTLPSASGIVRVGLPIEGAYFKVIGVDSGDMPSRKSTTPAVALLHQQSRGWKAGPDLDNLGNYPLDEGELMTGWASQEIDTHAEKHGGSFVVAQDEALPCAIMAAIVEVMPGGKGGG